MTTTIGRRYAKALLDLAEEMKQTDRVGKDLADFAESWTKSKELRAAFESPNVPRETRKKVLAQLLDRMAVAPIVKNGLLMLSDRGRLRHIGEVAAAFESLAEQRAGKVRAEVTTAVAMPDAYYLELTKVLENVTGKKVVLVKKQDPSLIGGVVARVGDKIFDGSLKNRLGELRQQLLAD